MQIAINEADDDGDDGERACHSHVDPETVLLALLATVEQAVRWQLLGHIIRTQFVSDVTY